MSDFQKELKLLLDELVIEKGKNSYFYQRYDDSVTKEMAKSRGEEILKSMTAFELINALCETNG